MARFPAGITLPSSFVYPQGVVLCDRARVVYEQSRLFHRIFGQQSARFTRDRKLAQLRLEADIAHQLFEILDEMRRLLGGGEVINAG